MVKMASSPAHTGLLVELIVGASGRALTITVAVVVVNGVLQSPRVMFVKVKVVFELTSLTVTSTNPPSSRGTI